jgi:hypothetical protein
MFVNERAKTKAKTVVNEKAKTAMPVELNV